MKTDRLQKLVMDSILDLKALDPVVINVSELTDVTDKLIIASGTSNTHVRALAENVCSKTKELGVKPLGVEGKESGDWVLVDFGDLVVHVMLPATREFYSLEKFWNFRAKSVVED